MGDQLGIRTCFRNKHRHWCTGLRTRCTLLLVSYKWLTRRTGKSCRQSPIHKQPNYRRLCWAGLDCLRNRTPHWHVRNWQCQSSIHTCGSFQPNRQWRRVLKLKKNKERMKYRVWGWGARRWWDVGTGWSIASCCPFAIENEERLD